MQLALRSVWFCSAFCLLLSAGGCAKRPPRPPAGTGSVTVGVTSTGPGVESLRFRVEIEPAGTGGPVNADAGIFTAAATPAGDHVVRLTDLPARCRVEGGAERKIRVTTQRSASLRFAVICK